uniref:Uncharacterized protein n=1 Tax=Anopheles atroparvus TaxID=41427 RepID=A0A182JFN6_ANOAO
MLKPGAQLGRGASECGGIDVLQHVHQLGARQLVRLGHTDQLRLPAGQCHRIVHRKTPDGQRTSTHKDGPVEQTPAERTHHVQLDRGTTGTLAEQRHRTRIAPERANVSLDPAERQHLIVHAGVTRCRRVTGREEPEHSQTVLDRHEDHALRGQDTLGTVQPGIGGAEEVAATVDKHHHRKMLGGIVLRTLTLKRSFPVGGFAYGIPTNASNRRLFTSAIRNPSRQPSSMQTRLCVCWATATSDGPEQAIRKTPSDNSDRIVTLLDHILNSNCPAIDRCRLGEAEARTSRAADNLFEGGWCLRPVYPANSSIALLESNDEDDLIEDETEEDVDELKDDETTLLLLTELTSDEDESSDEASAPPSDTVSVTLRSDANADSDFSCFLVIELADSSTIDFSLAEPKLFDCVTLFSDTPSAVRSTTTSFEMTGVDVSVSVISVLHLAKVPRQSFNKKTPKNLLAISISQHGRVKMKSMSINLPREFRITCAQMDTVWALRTERQKASNKTADTFNFLDQRWLAVAFEFGPMLSNLSIGCKPTPTGMPGLGAVDTRAPTFHLSAAWYRCAGRFAAYGFCGFCAAWRRKSDRMTAVTTEPTSSITAIVTLATMSPFVLSSSE